jgi:distribution and morphology protein 34
MAFNFNWSPLIADTSRAREMLTTALNKSPKPPIIVDDIIVTELNLGSTPPELEILEVGDLAEDRFRGIFKMTYAGDAFLTLKTKVQANPLNTYLSRKPSFASPEPLAAASGLTIPLQITLSDIRLSGFVILVFSKQKGLTLVFRNDPLESLKVSSTFDSIPFVRDYLQRVIEEQLRVLFMEDLPAIIHRLSLRLWSPEFQEIELEEKMQASQESTAPIDPLATNPPDAVDAFGNPLEETPSATLSLDTASEMHASFSRKNILRLAALSESQRTLSLFTPSIRDAVFRAWAGHDQATAGVATPQLTLSSLSRIQSTFNSVKSNSSSVASGSTGNETHSSRPTISSNYSASAGLPLGANKSRTHPMRKRKKRVINLRKSADDAESSGVSTDANTPASSAVPSEASVISEEIEELEFATTPKSSQNPPVWPEKDQAKMETGEPSVTQQSSFSEGLLPPAPILSDPPRTAKAKQRTDSWNTSSPGADKRSSSSRPPISHNRLRSTQQASSPLLRSLSFEKVPSLSSPTKNPASPSESVSSSSGGILEQAWMLKMAQEIARKVHEEKNREAGAAAHGHIHHPQPQSSKAANAAIWATESEPELVDAPPAYQA